MKQKGFTMIELIVAIAIMVFILAVILVNYRKFDSGIVMTNLAYDIALSIRTAQTYGVSTKGTRPESGNQTFETAHGVSFTSPSTSYNLFSDINDDKLLTTGLSLETAGATTYKLNGSYRISDICSTDGGTETCGRTSVDITFKRPNPDAVIAVGGAYSATISAVEIHLTSSQDASAEKIITVRPTGQISVN